jgi:Rrf2 family protein
MKVSKKAYYGLRAALALSQADAPLSSREIAEREHLPEDYLEKILQALRRAGLVESKKGVAGGYALAREPEEVTAWDIFRVLDGPLKIAAPPLSGTLPCFQVGHCQTNQVWRVLEHEMEQSLSRLTLASLCTHHPLYA